VARKTLVLFVCGEEKRMKKFVAVLDESLGTGIAMNILGHMTVSMGSRVNDAIGVEGYSDASGFTHEGMSKWPFIILKAPKEKIKEMYEKIKESGLIVVGAPEEVYTTYDDENLVKEVSAKKKEEIIYYGLCVYGEKEEVDSYTKGLSLYK